jgi:hypothetical protein
MSDQSAAGATQPCPDREVGGEEVSREAPKGATLNQEHTLWSAIPPTANTVIEFFLQIAAMYPKARLNIFGDKFETPVGAED